MSRRRFAAYFLALIAVLAILDAIIHPNTMTTEAAWGLTVIVIGSIIIHPRGRA